LHAGHVVSGPRDQVLTSGAVEKISGSARIA
jgi:hypothetical protein